MTHQSMLALSTSILALACSTVVHAQSSGNQGSTATSSSPAASAPAAGGTADANNTSNVGEIVVTAQRQTETLEKVPIAITAVTSANIRNFNMRNIDKIAAITPDLIYDTGYSFVQIYIRGIGVSNAPGIGLESPVALYIDGAYLPRGTGTIFDLLDVSSVEVLKGPQGTLYGHNASGGAILVQTANPTHDFSVDLLGEAGRFNHTQFDTTVNIPVTDTLSVRVSGRYRDDGGFVKNITTDEMVRGMNSEDGRIKIKWDPLPNFTAIASLDYYYDVGNANASGRESAPAPFCVACGLGARPLLANPYEVTEDFKRNDVSESKDFNLNLKYDTHGLTLTSITNYRDLYGYITDDSDLSALPLFVYDALYGGKTFEQDLQVSSSFKGWFNFLAGGQYINDRAYQRSYIYGLAFGLPYDNTITEERQRYAPANRIQAEQWVPTSSYAIYGELYVTPIDHLKITLGGRYSDDERKIHTLENGFALAILNPGGKSSFDQQASFTKFTPRAVVDYDFGLVNAYFSYTEGFKSGGFNVPSFTVQTDPINPETIDSYEVGAKFVSPDRRTRANLAVFDYEYHDAQVSLIATNHTTQIIKNAASAVGRGVELDATHKPTSWLTLGGGLSYLDAYYSSYHNAAVYKFTRDAAGNITGVATGQADLTGTKLPRSPDWSGYLSANVDAPINDKWNAHLSAVAHLTSSYLFSAGAGGDLNTDRQKGYLLVDLSGGFGPPSGAYELGFYIDNLTNTKYYTTVSVGGFGVDNLIAPPITAGLRVKAKF